MKKATLPQAIAILQMFADVPCKRVQALLASGLLADLRDCPDLARVDRDAVRKELGLPSLPHVVDLDAAPFCPEGWTVIEHRKGGQFTWNPARVELFLAEGQRGGGSIAGHELRRVVAGENPFNANLLDYLLAHQELIPEGWEHKVVFFWGTVYCGDDGAPCVCCRCLCGDADGRWKWDYVWLGNRWRGANPAAVKVVP